MSSKIRMESRVWLLITRIYCLCGSNIIFPEIQKFLDIYIFFCCYSFNLFSVARDFLKIGGELPISHGEPHGWSTSHIMAFPHA